MAKKIPDEFGNVMYEFISKELNGLSSKLCIVGNVIALAATICTMVEQFAEDCGYEAEDVANIVKKALDDVGKEEEEE